MRNAIVTGPTGGVGVSLVEELLKNNISVLAIVRPKSNRTRRLRELVSIDSSSKLEVVECELNEMNRLPELVNMSYDVFYHLGWDYSRAHNNVDRQCSNIKYTIDAVNAAQSIGCKTFVGAGSQAEYGLVDGRIDEQTAEKPVIAYGIAKLAAGQLSRILCKQKDIRHIWPRIFSVYGPGDAETTMVMSTIRHLLKGESPKLTAGEQMWDYLYAKDCALAMRLIGEKGISGKVYNVAGGHMRTLKSYIENIRDEINPEIKLRFGEIPYRDGQVMKLDVDISQLVEDTGFASEYTFRDGIKETIKWCQENSIVYKPEEV